MTIETTPTPTREAARDALQQLLGRRRTLAEIEGMTYEQAQELAQIGCELAAGGRLEDARTIFEGLVAGNPFDTSSLAALGTVYQRLHRPAEALECYDHALELFEGNIVALANRGELRLRLGQPGALEDLARAIQIDEKGVSAAGRRARALLHAVAERASEASPAAGATDLGRRRAAGADCR